MGGLPSHPQQQQQQQQQLVALDQREPPLQRQQQQQEEAPVAYSCQVLASRFPQHRSKLQRREPPLQPLQPDGPRLWHPAGFASEFSAEQPPAAWGPAQWQWELGGAAEEQAAAAGEEEQQTDPELDRLLAQLSRQPADTVQQVQFGEEGVWWQQELQPVLQQMEMGEQWGCERLQQGDQQPWDGMGSSGIPRLRLGSSEAVEALIGSWGRPEADGGPRSPGAWAADDWGPPLDHQARSWWSSRLNAEERALLQQAADRTLPRSSQRRPQSAPPHHKQRQRIEVVRRPQRAVQAAELLSGRAAAPIAPDAAVTAEAAAAAEMPPSSKAPEHPVSHFQDTAIRHYSGAEWAASQGNGGHPPARNRPAVAYSSGTALQQSSATAAQQQASVAGPPAAQQAVPDFLRPDAGLDELLVSWRRPSAGPQPGRLGAAAGSSGPEGILSLDTLSTAAFACLKPATLSREQLSGARALQQVDRKFVPIVCGSLLALMDQHAAGEWPGRACCAAC